MIDLQILKTEFTEAIIAAQMEKGQAVVKVRPEKIHEVIKFCKEDERFQMNMLMDVIGVDYYEETPRFEVVYILYSLKKKARLRLRVRLVEGQDLPTSSDLYPSADWAEREVWDMFGIVFKGHPKLKRILLFEGFEGHPLRKDYPVNKRQPIPEIEEIP